MIKQLRILLGKSDKNRVRSDLGFLLTHIHDQEDLQEKLDWLVRLLSWVRYEGQHDSPAEKETGKIPTARVRFLLMVLDHHPEWKASLAALLRDIINHISGMQFFTETGMSKEHGFFSEISDRVMQKILPQPALDKDLATLFTALFPDNKDHVWIRSIDPASFDRLVALFKFGSQPDDITWKRLSTEVEDALMYLVIQVRSVGLDPKILRRVDHATFRESPFFALVGAVETFLQACHSGDRALLNTEAERFSGAVKNCLREVKSVHKHLDEYGVSVDIVYQLARIEASLVRIQSLTDCLASETLDHQHVIKFVSALVRDNQAIRSIRGLVQENISLLARKVVDRSAETGEHYITRTKSEYRHMIQGAAGGGMITALTVYLKVFIVSLHATLFMEGFLSTINYSLSFVAIHLAGFTLATKQPAMTGPALAAKMKFVSSKEGMDDLVREIVLLLRSQTAAIFGNIMAVVPTVLLIDFMIHFLFSRHLMSVEKARGAFASLDILGTVIVYAAFTGILLWLSSLFSGWADNWFALRGLRKTLAQNPRLTQAFGKMQARRIAIFFEDNLSGITGSVGLGFLLGMLPQVFIFIGIPLGVCHVTLSSGSLAAAMPVLGWDIVSEPFFWRAIAGVLLTGFLNLSVSFALAFWVALRAKEVSAFQRRAIYLGVIKKFRRNPLTFFFPIGKMNERTPEKVSPP